MFAECGLMTISCRDNLVMLSRSLSHSLTSFFVSLSRNLYSLKAITRSQVDSPQPFLKCGSFSILTLLWSYLSSTIRLTQMDSFQEASEQQVLMVPFSLVITKTSLPSGTMLSESSFLLTPSSMDLLPYRTLVGSVWLSARGVVIEAAPLMSRKPRRTCSWSTRLFIQEASLSLRVVSPFLFQWFSW